jgi:Zinc carboxypeptidase
MRALSAVLAAVLVANSVPARPAAGQSSSTRPTTPREALGFNIGDDYRLATYTQLQSYWERLARESDRMALDTIGHTAEGRVQLMAIITAPENQRQLARYREIAGRLARGLDTTEAAARALAADGKAVVWVDGGLHATEVLGAHQLMELVYQMVSGDDPETQRILRDVILLAVHANPDGMELVSSWYMREPDTLKRRSANIPRLYQKYIGHDNNRDFYLVSQPETENMTRVQYHKWFPQIVYNHHQTGPQGTVLFAPPFRDPFNYFYDPLVPLGIDAVGAAMHGRFVAEGKPGATMRRGAGYSTWWNGGLRTTTYFHNMIGLLTETIGNPTPIEIPFIPDRQLASGDYPAPITPQRWHFRQSVDYSITANRAVLDYASRNREILLFNIWRMGRNSIERGGRDHWTMTPRRVEAVKAAVRRDSVRGPAPARYFDMLRAPDARDPRGYILSADQPDFPTATKFINALIKNGVTVHRATRPFDVGGKRYPAGSYVVKASQPFRPHVLDMFEPQDHPNDFQYPGGPPIPPYDNAGYTLAFQMGVQFDRILEGFDGPFEPIQGLATPLAGSVSNAENAAGFLVRHEVNDAALATNRLLGVKHEVYWLTEPWQANGKRYPAGTIYVPRRAALMPLVQQMAKELGVSFEGVRREPPAGARTRIQPARVALWDRYGGSMPSGWTRWLLERYEFPFEVVYPRDLDAENLAGRFDVLILPDGTVPAAEAQGSGGGGGGQQPDSMTIPAEFRARLGRFTPEQTLPRLREFLNAGGTIITIGSSTHLARHLGVSVENHLAENGRPLPREKFYVPGSVLRVRVDNAQPIAYGMPEQVDVFFDESPVWKSAGGGSGSASAADVQRVAWYDSEQPLRSGWAWGQERLQGGLAAAQARVGRGTLYLFGPEILFRAQPHGTFKFLFNGIHLARAGSAPPRREASR